MCYLYLQNIFSPPAGPRVLTILSGESSVKSISWEEGSDYITIITNSEVGIHSSSPDLQVERVCLELCCFVCVAQLVERRPRTQNVAGLSPT